MNVMTFNINLNSYMLFKLRVDHKNIKTKNNENKNMQTTSKSARDLKRVQIS